MRHHHRLLTTHLLLALLWIAVAVACLSSCSITPPAEIAAIDATTPKTTTSVDLTPVSEGLGKTDKALDDARAAVDSSEGRIKQLELEMLEARSHTAKLLALSRLLRESKAASADQLEKLAGKFEAAAKEHERDRLRKLVRISELRDDNSALRKAVDEAKFQTSETAKKLDAEKVKTSKLTAERDNWKSSYEGLKITASKAIKDRDDAQAFKDRWGWIVYAFFGLLAALTIYILIKLFA